jgi:hypothetical protein
MVDPMIAKANNYKTNLLEMPDGTFPLEVSTLGIEEVQ